MGYRVEFLMVGFLAVSWGTVLGGAMSICGILYYLSMLKVNVIDKKHNRKWLNYFKSFVKNEENETIDKI